ncbi:MAG TPA: alpha/beta hydrolase, partial [Verrucomicrobiae bacterium]|nr:alpha/beta hydrolase [Verrucomicrobiae bacterium]
IWADDLHELLSQLGALPAIVGGSSSGCRTALLFALRHPDAARALLLWRVTGGRFACERLAHEYYGQYIDAAKRGGMAAVCAMEHWSERIHARPENRLALMKIDPERFIAVMSHWREYFVRGADLPVIGASEAELRSIKAPACVVPGNDNTHGQKTGETLGRLLADAEVHVLFPKHYDMDLSPREEWDEKSGEMAALFADFIRRRRA